MNPMNPKIIPRLIRRLFTGLKPSHLETARRELAKMMREEIERRNREAINAGLPQTYHRDRFVLPQSTSE